MTRTARPTSPKLITIALAAGAATALLAGAQPATAKVVTETATVPSSGAATATATCPKGQRATGGGVQTTPHVPNVTQAYLIESRKIGQKAWTATAVQARVQSSGSVTAIAYCQTWAPKTKEAVVVGTSTADYDAYQTIDAVCPGSRTVQAGGFSVPTGTTSDPATPLFQPFADVIDFFRVAEGTWRGRFIGSMGAQVGIYAYCTKRKAPTETIGSALLTGNNSGSAISAPCEGKKKAVSGGFTQPDAQPNGNAYAYAWSGLLRVGKAWQTSASHFGGPTTLNSIAYCAKRPND